MAGMSPTGARGSRQSASTGKNSSSDGAIRRAAGTGSASCCSGITPRTGKLIYAGRAGTGMLDAELARVWQRLQPLAVDKMLEFYLE